MVPCQCRAKLRIVGERVETRREGRKARQSPDHEPETGGESRSGTHNPLVVGSSPTRPTTLYCRAASVLGAHASVALARHGVPAHRRAFHFAAHGGAGFLCICLSSRAFCRPFLPGFRLSVRDQPPCRTIPLESLKCFRGPVQEIHGVVRVFVGKSWQIPVCLWHTSFRYFVHALPDAVLISPETISGKIR